jgi:hypothetical protein
MCWSLTKTRRAFREQPLDHFLGEVQSSLVAFDSDLQRDNVARKREIIIQCGPC